MASMCKPGLFAPSVVSVEVHEVDRAPVEASDGVRGVEMRNLNEFRFAEN